MPKLRLLSFLLVSLIFGSTDARAQEVLNGIAAIVNHDVVTFSELRELVEPKEKQAHDTLRGNELVEKIKDIRLAAINDLIDRDLIIQDFKTKGFTIPDYFIDERITTVIHDDFGGNRQAFLRTLAAQGYTLDKFREFQRNMIIVSEMRKQAVKGITAVSEPKIAEYYKEHVDEYSQPEQMKLRLIAMHGVGNDARRQEIDQIRQKIIDGAEFGDLARMYSEDTTQEASGDWGWIDRKKLNESLTKIAFALKPGEVSQVVEMGGSFYLLFCEARKPASVKPMKEVHDEIEKALLQTERQQQQTEWLAKLRKKAYICIK